MKWAPFVLALLVLVTIDTGTSPARASSARTAPPPLSLATSSIARPTRRIAASSIQGDGDCSGDLGIGDAVAIRKAVAEGEEDWPCEPALMDTDCDLDLGAVDALIVMRVLAGLPSQAPTSCRPAGESTDPPVTSDDLIAADLATQKISYEESLLYRAYAVFNDSRLPEAYRTDVPDLSGWTRLLAEIHEHENELSPGLIGELKPWTSEPSNPASILNSTPALALRSPQPWQSIHVGGSGFTAWAAPGTPVPELEALSDATQIIWDALEEVFAVPLPDAGTPDNNLDPDSSIDL